MPPSGYLQDIIARNQRTASTLRGQYRLGGGGYSTGGAGVPLQGGGGGGGSAQSLYNMFSQIEERARLANLAREQEIRGYYDEIIGRYKEGGALRTAGEAQIKQAKRRDVGAEMQGLISGGLFGTTTTAQTGQRWEAGVGQKARLNLESLLEQRLTEAQLGKAGFIERIQEPYPDYSTLMQAMAAGGVGRTSYTSPISVIGRVVQPPQVRKLGGAFGYKQTMGGY